MEDISKFKTKTYQNSKQRDKEMEIMREQMRGLENRFMNIKRKRQWKDKIIIDIIEEIFQLQKILASAEAKGRLSSRRVLWTKVYTWAHPGNMTEFQGWKIL